MDKWEYMSVWVDRDWKVQTIVGYDEFRKDPERLPRFVEFLNLMGLVGWEMISIIAVDVGHRVFFKRRRT